MPLTQQELKMINDLMLKIPLNKDEFDTLDNLLKRYLIEFNTMPADLLATLIKPQPLTRDKNTNWFNGLMNSGDSYKLDIIIKYFPTYIKENLFLIHGLCKDANNILKLLPFLDIATLKKLSAENAFDYGGRAVEKNFYFHGLIYELLEECNVPDFSKLSQEEVEKLREQEEKVKEQIRASISAVLEYPEACESGDVQRIEKLENNFMLDDDDLTNYTPASKKYNNKSGHWNPFVSAIRHSHIDLLNFLAKIYSALGLAGELNMLLSQEVNDINSENYRSFTKQYLDAMPEEILLDRMDNLSENSFLTDYYLERFVGKEDQKFGQDSLRSRALKKEKEALTKAIFQKVPLTTEVVNEVYGSSNFSLLDIAVLHKNTDLISQIQALGQVPKTSFKCWKLAIRAIKNAGDTSVLVCLIDLYKNERFLPVLTDQEVKTTAFHKASAKDNLIAMELLLASKKVDFDFEETETHLPALHFAASQGSLEQVKMLLAQGATIKENTGGMLPSQCVPDRARNNGGPIKSREDLESGCKAIKQFLQNKEAKLSDSSEQISALTKKVDFLQNQLSENKELLVSLVAHAESQEARLASQDVILKALQAMVEKLLSRVDVTPSAEKADKSPSNTFF